MRKILIAVALITIFSLQFPTPTLSQSPNDAYLIGNGDILEIVTWKEEDFSRDEIIVRLDGKISFPLLDDVVAAGKTPTQLKIDIQEGLKEFLAEPHVTVTVRAATSKRFYILGEVVNTGEYPLTKNLTVLQAFALAGGFTEWADTKNILIVRREGEKEVQFRFNYKEFISGKNVEQNIMLKPNDTIVVP